MNALLIYTIGIIWICYAVEWMLTTGVKLFPNELGWLVDDDPKWGE